MFELLARQRQFLVFVAGGLLCAAIDVGIMQLLIASGVDYLAATSAGFGAGLLVNYAYHAKLTFRAAATPFNFIRFLCVVGINYLITIGCVSLSVACCDWALLGKLASLPLVAVNGFLLSKYWIFK